MTLISGYLWKGTLNRLICHRCDQCLHNHSEAGAIGIFLRLLSPLSKVDSALTGLSLRVCTQNVLLLLICACSSSSSSGFANLETNKFTRLW